MARTYTEQEIAALLARAAERQRTAPEADHGPTLTLDEIERIAVEAGLDPTHLRAAAAELDRGALRDPATPGRVLLERWVDVPFSEVGWEEAVGALRARYGTNMATYSMMATPTVPDTSRVGAAHEWRHINTWYTTTTTVTVSPRGDRTRVRIGAEDGMGGGSDRAVAGLWAACFAFLPALLIGAGAGAWMDSKGLGLIAVLAAFAVLTVVGAFAGAGAVRRSREKKARHAADALETIVRCLEEAAEAPAASLATAARETATTETAASETASPGSVSPATVRIDFDGAVGTDDEAADAERARARRREGA